MLEKTHTNLLTWEDEEQKLFKEQPALSKRQICKMMSRYHYDDEDDVTTLGLFKLWRTGGIVILYNNCSGFYISNFAIA